MAKPQIDQLLIQSALQPGLCRRLLESPDEVFAEFDLTADEMELLRQPDHRLLRLLGAALARQMKSPETAEEAPAVAAAPRIDSEVRAVPDAPTQALPDTLMALTVVPCMLRENGQLKGISYVMWVNPMQEGADPASLPPPAGTVLPGPPLAPLHAVVRISGVRSQDAEGNPQLRMWGSFQQTPHVSLPPPPESAGNVEALPSGAPLDAVPVQAAVAAVRQAASEERYDRLVDLLRALHQEEVR